MHYISADVKFRSLSDGDYEVCIANTGRTTTVERSLLEILECCDRVLTLEDHGDRLSAGEFAHLSKAEIDGALSRMIEHGLLRAVECHAGTGSDKRPFFHVSGEHPLSGNWSPVISVPSIGRTDLVSRLIGSLRSSPIADRDHGAAAAGPRVEIVLESEDSGDLSVPLHTRDSRHRMRDQILSQLASRGAAGHGQSVESLDALLRFALFADRGRDTCITPTTGSTRNAQYLAAGGQPVVSLDDDTLASGYVGSTEEAWSLSPHMRELEFLFATDRDELEAGYPVQPVSIGEHVKRVLGARVSVTSGESNSVLLDLSAATPKLFARIERSSPTVDVVLFGTIGDGGIGNRRILFSDSVHVSTVGAFQADTMLESRELIRMVRRPTITAHPFCMTTAFAYRSEALLPPFFPFGRGQDSLFGVLFTQLFDDALIAHLPVALLHDPEPGRSREPLPELSDPELPVCSLLAVLLQSYCRTRSPAPRAEQLVRFGEWLRGLSETPQHEFREWIAQRMRNYLERYRITGERAAAKYAEHAPRLARSAESLVENINLLLGREELPGVREYRRFGERMWEELASDLSLYGQLLEVWPDIVRSAQALRSPVVSGNLEKASGMQYIPSDKLVTRT